MEPAQQTSSPSPSLEQQVERFLQLLERFVVAHEQQNKLVEQYKNTCDLVLRMMQGRDEPAPFVMNASF